MDEPIKVDDIVDYSGFFDLSKYKLCFTADNEPVYVPMGEFIDEAETVTNKEFTPSQALKSSVPLWKKATLTLYEAAAYSGIGIAKLREITDERGCKFVLWNGNKRLIKRRLLDEYLEKSYSI